MPRKIGISAVDVKMAVQQIIPYLEDTRSDAPKVIYFNGWHGLGISAVLRAIAEHPPPSLLEKFDKIIHIDCSRWKSRRALQRAITDELNLTQHVAADFDKQDEEDDFMGLDQSSRAEIGSVTRVIVRSLVQYRCLVVFHNGSNGLINLASCGIPDPKMFDTKVLWTFSGRGRYSAYTWQPPGEDYAPDIHLSPSHKDINWNAILAEEARQIASYTGKLGLGITPEIVADCFLYLISMNGQKGYYYGWDHASSYLVCSGIVEGGQDNRAWELAHSLLQHMKPDQVYDDASNALSALASRLDITKSYFRHGTLHSDRFHKADQVRVLDLSNCTFSFSLPPFHCCHNLRFLRLDRCMDKQQGEEEKQTAGAQAVQIFQRLWVLDISEMDWELEFPLETEEPIVASDIREVHINKGRIWRSNFAWRRLPNLRKLRVVQPTSSWETGRKDEFMDMVKLELLDLSRNSTMQVLPSLSGATNLKTLILDGCVALEQIGPQGLPPSLESFSLHLREPLPPPLALKSFSLETGLNHVLPPPPPPAPASFPAPAPAPIPPKEAKISHISLTGCPRLTNFRLSGWLPNLEELDLSHTAVKMLELDHIVQVSTKSLQKVYLVGCEQLRSIFCRSFRGLEKLMMCIDTRAGGEVARNKASSFDSLMVSQGEGEEDEYYCHAFVAVTDMRLLQSVDFLWYQWETTPIVIKMNLYWSSTIEGDGRSCHIKEAAGSPLPRSLSYFDVSTEHKINAQIDGSSSATTPFKPLDVHMEIGEGVSGFPNKVSEKARRAICNVMNRVKSLHVHDNSSITVVTPEHIVIESSGNNDQGVMNELRWCRVEGCPRLQNVFKTQREGLNFGKLESFWAAHLSMARSIWHIGSTRTLVEEMDPPPFPPDVFPEPPPPKVCRPSFGNLRAIHLHFCPSLRYVLRLSWKDNLSQLETLHILCCGDLRQVFPAEQEFQDEIAASHETKGMLAFPKLKDIYLHDLSSLQLICEAKMFAPNLETIYVRGCWSLRRLPATDISRRLHPVAVDCEKECWDKLEWDGMELGHHPSLFQPRHSKYYKKRHLRATVLR